MMKKKKKDESRPPDFSTAITRVAVAQICQSVGFRASQRSALETLTDVATRYLRSIARFAAASAVSTGRTESNLLDIVGSLEELHSPIGFRGNSNVGQSLYSSSTIADIIKFVDYSRETPFAKPVPRRKNAAVMPLRLGSGCGGNQIPKWLPGFPEMRRKKEVGNGEERWGGISGEEIVEREGKKRVLELELTRREREGKKREMEWELPKERDKVRFKLGKGVNNKERKELVSEEEWNGVCRARGEQ